MNTYKRLPCWGMLVLVSLVIAASQMANAQVVSGSMVGNVTDAAGGFVPDATVKITLTTTNDSRSVQTDATGAYTISTVTPGPYRVEITREGFRTFVASDIR